MFGMPTQEAFQSGKWHIAGCDPDFPRHRDWGCNNCDAAFFKESESAVDSFLNNKNDTYSFNAGNQERNLLSNKKGGMTKRHKS